MSGFGENIKWSSIVLSFSAASLCIFDAIIMLNANIDKRALLLFVIVFTMTLTVYGIDRWLEVRAKNSELDMNRSLGAHRLHWLSILILIYIFSLLLAVFTNIYVTLLVAGSPLIILFYSKDSPFYNARFKFAIKSIPFLKSFYISAGWTFLGPFAYIYYEKLPAALDVVFLGLLFIKLFIMTVAYDFKDIENDQKDGTWTLPVNLGTRKTTLILHTLNFLATIGFVLLVIILNYNPLALVFIPLVFYQSVMILMSRKEAPEWVYYGFNDLEQFVWLLVLLTMRTLYGSS
jgi:4-hydroxybenzoate polyprenyltransferase